MQEKRYLNFGHKIAYGLGDFGCNFCFTFVSSFVLLYLTSVIGLNSKIVGTLMLVSQVFDGVTDIFFGTLIDRTHTRFGKARPWMMAAFVPLALCVFLEFSIPSWNEGLQYAYFFVIYTLMNAVFYTIFGVACNTLTALITKNNTERVQLGVSRYVFALTAAMSISALTPMLVERFGGGVAGYRTVALIYAGIMVVALGITSFTLKELPESELYEKEISDKTEEKNSFWKNLIYVFTNKYFLMILGIYIGNQIMNAIVQSVGIFFATYVIGDANTFGLFSMAGMLPMILGLFLTPIFVKKYGIFKTNIVSIMIATVLSVPYIFVGMYKLVVPMLVLVAVRCIFTSPITSTLGALTAEVSRNAYLKDKRRMEGAMFACSSMGTKIGNGLGIAISGWLLDVGGYDGLAAVQTEGALNMITAMYLIAPTISLFLQLLFMFGLNVEKENRQLEENNAVSN